MHELAVYLADLDRRAGDKGVTFAQGNVLAWSGTGNTVHVRGQDMTDLPYLDGVTATTGQQVALLKCANTWLVVGRIVTP